MFANALYWRHVNKIINNVPRSLADKPDQAHARGSSATAAPASGAMIGILFGASCSFGGGMLAAISIPGLPGLHDPRRRSSKVSILRALRRPQWPSSTRSTAAGRRTAKPRAWGTISGKYVESVKVDERQHRHHLRRRGEPQSRREAADPVARAHREEGHCLDLRRHAIAT